MDDEKKFYETYIKPFIKGLFDYAYKMTNDSFLAEDLVQETIIRIIEKFDTIKKKESIKYWLFKTLKNNYLDKCKKFSRLVIVESEDIEKDYQEFLTNRISIEDEFIKKDLSKEINDVINQLPDIFKEIIILNEIENFKYEEIAEILDIPIGTVKSRLARARKLLEASLYKIALREGIIKTNDKIKNNVV